MAAPFLLGKLPAHGDFVSRGLASAERDAWDAWGAGALDSLRARAGAAFGAAHGQAPAWRFVTASRAGWRAGALAPSVDGVGRRFLLLLGADGLDAAVAGAAGLALADAAEALAFDAIAGSWDADRLLAEAGARFGDLVAAAQVVASTFAAAPQSDGAWWTLGGSECPPMAAPGREPPVDLFASTFAGTSSLETVA